MPSLSFLALLFDYGIATLAGSASASFWFGLKTAYGFYTSAAAISLFFVLFFIRETKGMELEQM